MSAADLPLERLYYWERERADRTFLTQPFGGGQIREWTWGETAREVRSMAAYLKAQNWEPGSRVAILSKNCAWWFLADLAISMAGHVTVPVYPSLQADSVRLILEHCEARACFLGATDEKSTASLGIPRSAAVITFPTARPGPYPKWDSASGAYPPLTGELTRGAGELATIIYTSGTTGIPKGVMHRFGDYAFFGQAIAATLDLGEEQRLLSYLPLAHIIERTGLEMPAIQFGWRVFFTEGIDTFVHDVKRARPTMFLTVPRLLMKLQQGVFEKMPKQKLDRLMRIPVVRGIVKRRILKELGFDAVKQMACGGAPLPPAILDWYCKLGVNLWEGYGLTETYITHLPRTGRIRAGYVGEPVKGVEAKREANGELLLRSPMNMMGYYKQPQATQEAFTEDGFFRTGDLVEIDSDEQLKIIGRIKEQFKTSKGKYVAPAPIEGRLAAHPAVESCCLMGAGQPSPFAVIVLSDDARKHCAQPEARQQLEKALAARLQEVNAQLDPHERLAFVAITSEPWTVENGLITPTLKIRRNALESRYSGLIEDWNRQNRPVVWDEAREVAAGS